MSTELEVRRRTKRKAKPLPKEKVEIRVRYRYSYYRTIKTPLVGSFRSLWPKYKDKYEFYCADVPPEFDMDGYMYTGYRLDEKNLHRYGSHKAWLDSNFKVRGKPVILVFNAE